MDIGAIWDLVILSPMINVMVMLSHYLGGSLGLAIIMLTIVVRGLMYPLTRRQLHASKAMQSIQTEVAELKKKYAKDKQKLAQEQMKLYKQSGMNPAGCLVPMLIQMPIWIALYQSIIRVLALAPEDFLNLSRHLYPSWSPVFSLVPLESSFLWLDLATPDRWLILPILVGASMWAQQKMTMRPSPDPKQQSQSQMMLWLMPLMFAFLALSFPSGLALYWVTSSIIGIVMQYFVTGWGGLIPSRAGKKGTPKDSRDRRLRERIAREGAPLDKGGTEEAEEVDTGADIVVPSSTEEGLTYGRSGDKSQDSGGSYQPSLRAPRRKPGGGRSHRRKRR